MGRNSLIALSGAALGAWLFAFGGSRPKLLFVVLSAAIVSGALFFGNVISTQLARNAPSLNRRKTQLFQWLTMVAWLAMAYWILSGLAHANHWIRQ